MRQSGTAFLLIGLIALTTAAGARDIRTEQVRFKAGKTSTSITGKIVGDESVSYVLGAEAGQTMTVTLKPSNRATYFNLYAPGKGPGDEALASSDRTTPALNVFSGKLQVSGQYTISVYMMRSAARRKERSNFTLNISISALRASDRDTPVQKDFADGLQGGPDYWDIRTDSKIGQATLRAEPSAAARVLANLSGGSVLRNQGCRMAEGRRWCSVQTIDPGRLSGWVEGDLLRESSFTGTPIPSRDALVPGTKFNATGTIPCARYAGQPMNPCRFGVVRRGDGSGEVTVFWPDGGSRVIFFKNAAPASFDQSAADGDIRINVTKNSDLFTVTIGTQRFEIPEAVISGG